MIPVTGQPRLGHLDEKALPVEVVVLWRVLIRDI
jgi:hypothetical protein